MIKGIHTSAAGLVPKTIRMEVLANNLANINSTGFKRDDAFFELVNDRVAAAAESRENRVSAVANRFVDFSEGSYKQTSNPLDLALQGDGFFVVETPNGLRFTRNGNFSMALDGTLVTQQGYPVMGSTGRLQVPDLQKHAAAGIVVTETGEIRIDKTLIGALRIVRFDDPSRLQKAGASLFLADEGVAPVDAQPGMLAVKQGYLEESNVDGIAEMIALIEITRQFETEQKAIQLQDSTLEKANELGRLP